MLCNSIRVILAVLGTTNSAAGVDSGNVFNFNLILKKQVFCIMFLCTIPAPRAWVCFKSERVSDILMELYSVFLSFSYELYVFFKSVFKIVSSLKRRSFRNVIIACNSLAYVSVLVPRFSVSVIVKMKISIFVILFDVIFEPLLLQRVKIKITNHPRHVRLFSSVVEFCPKSL